MANQPTSFQKLPAEMLGYIFEECIEEDNIKSRGGDLGVSPWLLAQVCRFWYQTAKGTPSLWRKLLITDRSKTYWSLKRNQSQYPSKNTHTRLHSSMQVCVNGPEVASALKRSGAASLELTLAFGGILNASKSQLDSAFYQELYDMVFNEHVASRISHLVIDSEYRDSLDWLFWSGEQLESISLPSISLPTLISLQIHSLKPLLFNAKSNSRVCNEAAGL
jgi:F-box-like